MKTKNPIKAKSTKSLLSVFPPDYKMVYDESSNGYKFVNMMFGIEMDEAKERLKSLYDSYSFDTLDLSEDYTLYEVNLSGTPHHNGYLNNSGIKIKIASEDEFYNGDPTRVNYVSKFSIASGTYPIIGINYFRQSYRGSGYILLSYDVDEGDSYSSGVYSARKCAINNTGLYLSASGLWTGIKKQDYSTIGSDEILAPTDQNVLSGKYPMYRSILISGTLYNIDHYEPYKGWTYDSNGNVVAVNDYYQDYYFDEDGNKIFHRTYLNNPYGAGNYTKQYFNLRHTPISGTFTLLDMDILDISGNATNVASTGSAIYYLAYSGMLNGTSGHFEPVYKGYYQNVPSGQGFNYIEGDQATLLTTVSWDYQRKGTTLDQESGVWIEPSTGNFTNLISITNPQSRYIAEYSWKAYNKASYITSIDATRYLSLDTNQPIYSIENLSGNVNEIDFSFTNNPKYIKTTNGASIDQRSQILTFNGLKYRPKSRLYQVKLNVPIVYTEPKNLQFFNVPYKYNHIGYSDDFVPQINSLKTYAINCPFDNDVNSYAVTEDDLTGNSNTFQYSGSLNNKLFKTNFDSWYGKKIVYLSGDSYFYTDMTNKSFLKNNTFFKFAFRPLKNQTITLLDLHEDSHNQYMNAYISPAGIINVSIGGYNFKSKEPILMDSNKKEILIRYYEDDLYSGVPIIDLYYKDSKYHYQVARTFRQLSDEPTISSSYFYIFKSCSVDIDEFQLYYEAF